MIAISYWFLRYKNKFNNLYLVSITRPFIWHIPFYVMKCIKVFKFCFLQTWITKKFEDIKGLIRGRKSNKDSQYNDQKKKDKTDL